MPWACLCAPMKVPSYPWQAFGTPRAATCRACRLALSSAFLADGMTELSTVPLSPATSCAHPGKKKKKKMDQGTVASRGGHTVLLLLHDCMSAGADYQVKRRLYYLHTNKQASVQSAGDMHTAG